MSPFLYKWEMSRADSSPSSKHLLLSTSAVYNYQGEAGFKQPDGLLTQAVLHHHSIETIMVWVSNRSSQTIKVTITNTTGGEGATFDIVPEPLLVETWGQNHWGRNGAENVTVVFEKSGVKFQTALSPLDVLLVYNDTYIVQTSTKVGRILRQRTAN
ncbi:hypothetical protein CCMSSC00406_0009299 [Pleurotus cornucopiae]|uniref:Uncharacterized protein n=1 Tax=Pleurotus cornucopiae TaxID=5321 RepID=A0ACB7IWH3_PLECO|nr:hypothetical protein CCMSSC00406_0009299 [Pleurotus cornucopiae]